MPPAEVQRSGHVEAALPFAAFEVEQSLAPAVEIAEPLAPVARIAEVRVEVDRLVLAQRVLRYKRCLVH